MILKIRLNDKNCSPILLVSYENTIGGMLIRKMVMHESLVKK